jgi:hypothetical protein
MVWLLKSKYEKHADKLHGKLFRIVSVLDSSELRQLCLSVTHKIPRNGLKLFDSDYNLIKKFSNQIYRDDYLLFFSHYYTLGKIPDMKLAKYLIKTELFDENDSDYEFVKKSDANVDDDVEIISPYPPRNDFSAEVKDKILKLQHFRCAVPRCTFPTNLWKFLEFDHIKGRDDNSITNCQALCPFHHRLKSRRDNIKRNVAKDMVNERKSTVSRPARKFTPKRRHRHHRRF